MSEQNTEQLWRDFKENGCQDARERLILEYAPLVKYVAGRVAIGLPPSIEFDDLVSYGIFGLIDSIEKFDPDRGVRFETYAISRIRGAMIDGLRSVDWVPRSVRRKSRELEEAIGALEIRLGRPPEDAEISDYLGLTLDEYHDLLLAISATTLNSLDDVWNQRTNGGNETIRFLDMIEDSSIEDPAKSMEFIEMRNALAEAIDELPERERLVIALYYYEGLTLKEIGRVLKVSESRVCQIHSKAIAGLRARLRRTFVETV